MSMRLVSMAVRDELAADHQWDSLGKGRFARLRAGGRRIRTIGPSCKKRVVLVETPRILKGADDRDPSKLQPFSRGTGSSNPSLSSGESVSQRELACRGREARLFA